mgnify:CR=1 FL=1
MIIIDFPLIGIGDVDRAIYRWFDTLPLMEDGTLPVNQPNALKILFKREEDAIAFKLKFGQWLY